MMKGHLGALDCVLLNLWGPSKVPIKSGASYILMVIDDFSRKVWVFFMKHENEVCLLLSRNGTQ